MKEYIRIKSLEDYNKAVEYFENKGYNKSEQCVYVSHTFMVYITDAGISSWDYWCSPKIYSKQIFLTEDIINKPPHYTKGWIQPIDYIISNKMDFCEWAIIKYITRYKHKNWLEDLQKAQFFINKLIKDYENK